MTRSVLRRHCNKRGLFVVAVLFRVPLGGFVLMVGRVQVMTKRHARMVRGFFVVAGFVVLGGFAMVLRRFLVVMRGFFVVLVDVVLVQILAIHRQLPGCCRATASIRTVDEPIATGVCQSRRFAARPESMHKFVRQQRDGAGPIAELLLTK